MAIPFLHRQPWKSLYLTYFLTGLLLRLPLWLLISIPRSQRPHRDWTLAKCVRIYFLRSVIDFPDKLGIPPKRDLTLEIPESALKNAKFAWVEGVDAESLRGDVREYAEKAGVKPIKIPGYWQFKDGRSVKGTPEAKDGEKTVYHLHGGGMYLGTAHPEDASANIPRGLLDHSTALTRTFALDYRLCTSMPFPAQNPFPAALIDCIAGYRYLLSLGFQPQNITIAGDSAGGNLALALTRYIVENPTSNIPLPGKLLLLSPWGDLSSSRWQDPASSLRTNSTTDIFAASQITEDFGGYGVRSYLGSILDPSEAKTNIYISPASPHAKAEGRFTAFPKTYILVGGAEMLLDDATVIAGRMGADCPEKGWVTLDVVEDAVHDFIALPWWEPGRTEALKRMCKWIDG